MAKVIVFQFQYPGEASFWIAEAENDRKWSVCASTAKRAMSKFRHDCDRWCELNPDFEFVVKETIQHG